MPKKVLRSQSVQYPYKVQLNKTKVITRDGVGTVTQQKSEWLFVKLDHSDRTVRTNIFYAELIETI
ncbi:hypothetical protein E0485_02315 [Paenibacillus albiflavus]|uniref:Uncharacterized protein n=1 Tax=Paenibacillus albiflavus TaxID=2545760 RepID=A0A4R4ENU7_9BACL|nr:hypothetical protein [Paenibacillus albiflavus]TCZ81130.1 hypothetical protein E0485_02315 [Paenibacillus albiflavus]